MKRHRNKQWADKQPKDCVFPHCGCAPMCCRHALRKITDVPVTCRLCEWQGVIGDCLPGDDGEPLCGSCASYDLDIHYLPHERTPMPKEK